MNHTQNTARLHSHIIYVMQAYIITHALYRDVVRLVDDAVAAVVKPPNNRIYTEVLRHLHTCQTFASDCEGRTEVTNTSRMSVLIYQLIHSQRQLTTLPQEI